MLAGLSSIAVSVVWRKSYIETLSAEEIQEQKWKLQYLYRIGFVMATLGLRLLAGKGIRQNSETFTIFECGIGMMIAGSLPYMTTVFLPAEHPLSWYLFPGWLLVYYGYVASFLVAPMMVFTSKSAACDNNEDMNPDCTMSNTISKHGENKDLDGYRKRRINWMDVGSHTLCFVGIDYIGRSETPSDSQTETRHGVLRLLTVYYLMGTVLATVGLRLVDKMNYRRPSSTTSTVAWCGIAMMLIGDLIYLVMLFFWPENLAWQILLHFVSHELRHYGYAVAMVFIIMRLLVSESAAAVDDDVSDEKRGLQSEAVECHEQNSCTTADDTAQPTRKRTAAVFDV